MNATASIPTASARRYLGQFVSHFAHKLTTARDEANTHGEVNFPLGLCTLAADETRLGIIVNAQTAEDLTKLEEIVDRHLLRFSFREALTINWQ
ncbi:MAG: DUF2218 domain-containing protein [Acidocella sp.]|nr:DUF2218 domain-containing protein [Acidocella sp.]